jgi:Mg2+-importing ATPase
MFYSVPLPELLTRLETSADGLSASAAASRRKEAAAHALKPRKKGGGWRLGLAQFKSPITLILIFAAVLSLFLRDFPDAIIILLIVLASGALGFWQEKGAADIVDKLLSAVRVRTTVVRGGRPESIAVEDVVPGDLVLLEAGDLVPADARILESKDLFVDEATLTGETFPVEKTPGTVPPGTGLARRTNALFLGTHVVSGTARAVVAETGMTTEFGRISGRMAAAPPETEFERGVRRFGNFLLEITLILVIVILAINVYFHRSVVQSFLFAMALAVGLTPQLLPAIISINLAHGAKRMARDKVIVKRLASIENFGSMSVLCSDKTGTLTEGTVSVQAAIDTDGRESERVLRFAFLNSVFESGFRNPIDEAIRTHRAFDISQVIKEDEIPYDFGRKRKSVLVRTDGRRTLITKGAVRQILDACGRIEREDGSQPALTAEERTRLEGLIEDFQIRGLRTIGVAVRDMPGAAPISKNDERDMVFLGFLVLSDNVKPEVGRLIQELADLGVSLKIITGDSGSVAAEVSRQIGRPGPRIMTGIELESMRDEALVRAAPEIDVFAEIEPNQKDRIVSALKKSCRVVGFLGDGINDAPALHTADVGISVDSAVDVAKEAADIILLEKNLEVLVQGIQNGRMTFANTLKYVFMATSANFGNMFSMAAASLVLPFFPLLPKQILLTNLLTDFPEMGIANDRVDPEMTRRPRRWNIAFIRNFMLAFGPLSSVFDFLTFGTLLVLLHATEKQFRTGWFTESVVSAAAVVLVIRTRRPFYRDRPSGLLFTATLLVMAAAVLIPFTPLAGPFGFERLPPIFYPVLGIILALYIASAEAVKSIFYRIADPSSKGIG